MVQTCELPIARASELAETDAVEALHQMRAKRTEAEAVLQGLLEAKAECEAHSEKMNRSDLFKRVTGRTGLDSAIQTTQRMIEQLDRTLANATCQAEVKATFVAGLTAAPR